MQTGGEMRYRFVILALILAGCNSHKTADTSENTSKAPADVVAIRGASGPSTPSSSITDAFAQKIEGDLNAYKHAKDVAATANHKIQQDEKQTDSSPQ